MVAGNIIFITGDAANIDVKEFLKKNNLPFLAKPFNRQALEQKINEIMNKFAT
jgi:FixJ family two-component response regulator